MTEGQLSQEFRESCQRQFQEINQKLDRLDKALRGNGEPGITVRLDRLEQDAKRQARLTWMLIGAGLAGGVSVLVTIVTT